MGSLLASATTCVLHVAPFRASRIHALPSHLSAHILAIAFRCCHNPLFPVAPFRLASPILYLPQPSALPIAPFRLNSPMLYLPRPAFFLHHVCVAPFYVSLPSLSIPIPAAFHSYTCHNAACFPSHRSALLRRSCTSLPSSSAPRTAFFPLLLHCLAHRLWTCHDPRLSPVPATSRNLPVTPFCGTCFRANPRSIWVWVFHLGIPSACLPSTVSCLLTLVFLQNHGQRFVADSPATLLMVNLRLYGCMPCHLVPLAALLDSARFCSVPLFIA